MNIINFMEKSLTDEYIGMLIDTSIEILFWGHSLPDVEVYVNILSKLNENNLENWEECNALYGWKNISILKQCVLLFNWRGVWKRKFNIGIQTGKAAKNKILPDWVKWELKWRNCPYLINS